MNVKIHIAKQGETLHDVARRYQIDVNVLYGYNPHIRDPYNMQDGLQLTIPSLIGIEGVMTNQPDGKGNVCAFVPDGPVQYNKLNIKHWPSQDYTNPIYGTHHQHKDFTKPVIYPQHRQVYEQSPYHLSQPYYQ